MIQSKQHFIQRFALKPCLASLLLAGAATSSHASVFTLSAPDGDNTVAAGQAFVPTVDETPDTGLGAGDSVFLNNFSFTSGGAGGGSASTRLAIFSGAFFDFTAASEADLTDAVAISSNSVDSSSASDGDVLSFNFNSVELAADGVFSAVFVTEVAGGKIAPVAVSTKFVSFSEVSPGNFQPTINLGGAGNFDFVSLFPDFNADGFFEAGSDGQDLGFTATFSTVPEPGSMALSLAAGGLVLCRRRRLTQS
ncbi:MAG: PEP-CTERM sorting domain-containing protein [Planctomycetota bacterium]